MQHIQVATHTSMLRYPHPLETARAYFAHSRGGTPLRLLSFGCSMGDELASLRLVFPDDHLFGCDLDAAALETARASVGHFAEVFLSDETALRERAPYDAVFAFSSLCINPPPPGAFALHFPFAVFARLIGLLDEVLAPGGLLVLYNTSYLFSRTRAAKGYDAVSSDRICQNGFINIYDEVGDLLVRSSTSPTGALVRSLVRPEMMTESDLIDCVFAKRPARGLLEVSLHDASWWEQGGYRPLVAWTRSELDGFPPDERPGFIDMRRNYRAYVGPDGAVLYEYDVDRPSLDERRRLKLATYGPYSPAVLDVL